MTTSTDDWKAFYQHSLELFQFLEQHTTKLFLENERASLDYAQDTYGIVTSALNAGYVGKVPMAPRFIHTICQLNTEEDLARFQMLLQQYQELYVQAAQTPAATTKFPFLMPRLLDASVYQININSSKAFLSKAIHPKDGPHSLKTWSYTLEDYVSFEAAVEAADAALRQMEQAGFPVSLREQETKRKQVLSLDVDTAALCQQLACSHIQYRKPSGTQYKAQLLHRDQDTVRDSLGVYVVRPQQHLDIYHSIPRKTRKDALFVEHHPDEIVFPLEVDGSYYRKQA
jgi:hypothetical protein